MASVLAPDLVRPPWHVPAPAPSRSAEHGALWRRGDWQSSLLGFLPCLYSTCPSFASTGGPPLEAGPPPPATRLGGGRERRGRYLENADEECERLETFRGVTDTWKRD